MARGASGSSVILAILKGGIDKPGARFHLYECVRFIYALAYKLVQWLSCHRKLFLAERPRGDDG